MTFKIVGETKPNTFAFETSALVKPTGFREYDARWWFGHPGSDKAPELNLIGVQALGMGLGTLIHRLGVGPDIVVGHDFRSYSMSIKLALTAGLMAAGARVKDIGLALSPMAYFAQFALDTPSVAMVTASHNENGWTGVKMGAARPLTFGPDEMSALKKIVLEGDFDLIGGGAYEFVPDFRKTYLDDLTKGHRISRKLKVVAACGNGTAGAFAPEALERIGCEVIPLDVELDHSFPHYNPNPEDMHMLHAIRDKVLETGADVGLGFDGDGDRCGVVDNEGNEIFADKVGVMLARDISAIHPNSVFVADVKSTGLFATDPVLRRNGAKTDYWKTGHSYMKRRVTEIGAIAGFEKSGHYFFNPPIGRGYDDGLVTAIAICEMLDRNPGRSMADLYRDLPLTHGTPTMSPHCPDELKYGVVDRVVADFAAMKQSGATFAGQKITDLITVNGVRVVAEDGTWGLVRASSNKPEIVVVVESPVSSERRREMFNGLDAVLRRSPEVGAYNQTF
ncbi:phosphomannomutase/phosphoglucomutase [Pseudaminobacter soli (ex Li et al. 2025)]|uniref:Phosphomannomutase/phosphoglucomutase n=1 Tax=Pseudaminobacter soli (ex Li et al. 2025) TaxID=1295366 RepID=A0A2P7SFZ6_9HYPH|nr:phosphomannomutase/phosphoglucomutase [Mesorhizobium soli]PSJ61387.1 phosphomannomutase/phosphoglucomutase [Mesorhizobium soli]